jgi:periplasmic divalent cation tolerance protein
MEMQQALLVLTNVPDAATARHIARQLIERQVAACVNSMPGVHSTYRWQGVLEETHEVTLFIKTTQVRYAELERELKSLHPYEIPEIIAVPVIHGLPAYLDWIAEETKRDINA